MTKADHSLTLNSPITQADLEAAEPFIVDGVPRSRLINVGGGLGLQITAGKVRDDGTYSVAKSWIVRYYIDGVERRTGIGSFGRGQDKLDLDAARIEALSIRKDVKKHKIDPIERNREEGAKRISKIRAQRVTFAAAAEEYITIHEPEWGKAYGTQWRFTIARYANPVIGNLRVADLTKAQVLDVLEPHWHVRTATMQKLRVRIATVVQYAIDKGYRPHGLEDPAAWSNLKRLLTKPSKIEATKPKHRAALPYTRVKEFMTALAQDKWTPARAVELAILTATRTDEVRLAVWEEIDLQARTWTIPSERMKSDRPHKIPLSGPAIALLTGMKGDNPNPTGLVFRGQHGAIADTAMLRATRRVATKMSPPVDAVDVTMHGFRSSFKTWAGEDTGFPRDVIEKALAHKVGNSTEEAYDRGDLFVKRTKLMQAWAGYLGLSGLKLVASNAA